MDCDILAGERGPSWTETSQISNWKVIHVRFVEKNDQSQGCDRQVGHSYQTQAKSMELTGVVKSVKPTATKVAASVSLNAMLKLGKLIQPSTEIVSIELEEFDIHQKQWRPPFEARFPVAKEKFASGSFRDVALVTVISGHQSEKYVVKKFKSDQVEDIKNLFTSVEVHTRKVVQMNSLTRNFVLKLTGEAPDGFWPIIGYTMVYLASLGL